MQQLLINVTTELKTKCLSSSWNSFSFKPILASCDMAGIGLQQLKRKEMNLNRDKTGLIREKAGRWADTHSSTALLCKPYCPYERIKSMCAGLFYDRQAVIIQYNNNNPHHFLMDGDALDSVPCWGQTECWNNPSACFLFPPSTHPVSKQHHCFSRLWSQGVECIAVLSSLCPGPLSKTKRKQELENT